MTDRAILAGTIRHDPLTLSLVRVRPGPDGQLVELRALARLELPAGAALPPEGPALVDGDVLRWIADRPCLTCDGSGIASALDGQVAQCPDCDRTGTLAGGPVLRVRRICYGPMRAAGGEIAWREVGP